MKWIVRQERKEGKHHVVVQELEFFIYEKMSDYVARYIRNINKNTIFVNGRKVNPWGQTWVFADGKGPYNY